MIRYRFEGITVMVHQAIHDGWVSVPTDKKCQLIDSAYEKSIRELEDYVERGVEELWSRECAFFESLGAACRQRGDAEASRRAAKELDWRARMIEQNQPANLRKRHCAPAQILRSVLCNNWVRARPREVCLCWFSYPALAKFLRFTGPGLRIPDLSVPDKQALEKWCRRDLGFGKLGHPLVEEDQVCDWKPVRILGNSHSAGLR